MSNTEELKCIEVNILGKNMNTVQVMEIVMEECVVNIIKSVFSNTKIKIVCALCAALCVAACVQVILNHSFPDDVKITEAFIAGLLIGLRYRNVLWKLLQDCRFGEGSLYKSAKPFLSELNRALGYGNI